MIGVIDLGIGNLENVRRAAGAELISDAYLIERAEKLIFPGVGNFGEVAEKIETWRGPIRDFIADGKPFLGICLGLHYLFEGSEEQPGVPGLGVFRGRVVRFRGVRAPHIGWNRVWQLHDAPIFRGIRDGAYFYFVHSYYPEPEEDVAVAFTEHGDKDTLRFVSAVWRDSVYGVQFHPEKSGRNGMQLLRNFRRL